MKKYTWTFFLILVSLIPLIPLLHQGLPITHDGQDHVARIANFNTSLHEGVLVPRWAGNLNWGYGHPILMFLYPLPSYIAAFFRFLGFSFTDSTKLVFAVMFVLSGLAMYVWLKESVRKEAAFLGALVYVFAPYRFVDLYVRGAIGEHAAFVFPPLICFCIYKLIKAKNNYYLPIGGIALAGLILAHNAISLMFIPFIGIYALLLIFFEKRRSYYLISLALLFVIGFLLSAFFWIPAFFEGKYTLRDIVALHDYAQRLYPLRMFIYSKWSFGQTGDFSLQVGAIQWLAVILGSILIVRKKLSPALKGLMGLLVGYFLVTFLLMLPVSTIIWDHVSLLQKFQFPWRFLSVSVFTCAALGALSIDILIPKNRAFMVAVSLLVVFLTIPFWKVNGYLNKPDTYFSGVYAGTTDTGESAPIWSVRFMEHIPKAHIEAIQGSAHIQEVSRTSTKHVYKVSNAQNAVLRENTLYFPGWAVMIDGKNTPIEFQDPNSRGIISFAVPDGVHDVVIAFSETKLRLLADTVSVFGLLLVAFSFILVRTQLWKRYQ